MLAFQLAGKQWDIFLLIPGALLGAIFGLLAMIWWQHLQKKRGSPPATIQDEEVADVNRSPYPSQASASSRAESRAEVKVTLHQIGGVPSPGESRRKKSWMDDLEPAELIGFFLVTAVVLSGAYAWARPLIQSVYLFVGSLGVALCLTLLLTSLFARVLGGVRLLTVLVIGLFIFTCTTILPWVIEGADYPFKDYSEVLRLVGVRPLEVVTLYGSTGVLFLLYQLGGVILVGYAAAMMIAVVGAAVLGVTAVLSESMSASLAGFRRRSFGLSLFCAVICGLGVWMTTGAVFRLTDQNDTFARDKQAPHIFEASLAGRGRTRTARFRLDEDATMWVAVQRQNAHRKTHWTGRRLHAGPNRIKVTVPSTARRIPVTLKLHARDVSGHWGKVRNIETSSAVRQR